MARARNIKPSFFQNEELGELDPLARIFFIWLWTVADSSGCVEFRPEILKAQLLPYDYCSTEDLATNLERHGFVQFCSIRDRRYIKIESFNTWVGNQDRSASYCMSSAKRRAAKRMASPSWADRGRINEIYADAARRRANGEDVHVDHVLPLSGVLVSGLHVDNNLQIIPARDNLKKSNGFEVSLWLA